MPDVAPDAQPVRDADVGYYVLVDRFADGDLWNNESFDIGDESAWHGGDLRGVLDKLDHLRDLGVGSVWLSPIQEAYDAKVGQQGAYHGYWTVDLEHLEPRFGSLEAAVALGRELKQRRMDLVLEVVTGAMAPGSATLAAHPDWARQGGERSAPGQGGGRGGGIRGFSLLDHANPQAYKWVLSELSQWVSTLKPDGLHLRDVDALSPDFVRRLVVDVQSARRNGDGGMRVTGDAPATRPADLARKLRETGLSAVFDHPLRQALVDVYCRGEGVGRLGAVLSGDWHYGEAGRQLITVLDTPDVPRFATECAHEGRGPVERQQALAFLLSSRGTPLLTFGTEFGMGGDAPPDSHGDVPWGEDQPYGVTIREFSEARRAWPSLAEGAQWVFHLDGAQVLGIARVLPDEASVVLVNRGSEQAMVRLPDELSHGAAMATFHEVDSDRGPYQRHQLIANPGSESGRVRPFFLVGNSTLVAHLQPGQPGGFAQLHERVAGFADRQVETLFRVDRVPEEESGMADLEVAPGDLLVLHGEGLALGDWSPRDVIVLEPEPGGGWLSPPVELRTWSVAEWRLGVRRPGGHIEWEAASRRWSLVGEPEHGQREVVVRTSVLR